MIEELAWRIWGHQEFHDDYKLILSAAIKKLLDLTLASNIERKITKRLLQCATTFSSSTEPKFREAAYKIAISTWILNKNEYDGLQDVITLILSRLGNFPSIKLIENQTKNKSSLSPLPLVLENLWHEENNTVEIFRGRRLLFTDFQRNLWSYLEAGISVSVSAPTSAGKSFAFQQYIANKALTTENFVAVYLVPTRALINQVSSSLQKHLRDVSSNIIVSTIPAASNENSLSSKILYVLTQERLQILSENTVLACDLLIVDESQLIAEDSRGIILQTVIEKSLNQLRKPQILFAAPLTSNPEMLPDFFGITANVINEQESPVAQNIIFLDTIPTNPYEVAVSMLLNQKKDFLETKTTKRGVYDDTSILVNLAWEFGRSEKNLVYAGGPAECEDIALMLSDIKKEERSDENVDPLVIEFAKFVREQIHKEYRLASTLEQGIAFHYGNMPAIIRKTIEDLFEEGKLEYLVCTSTLLHGINLPAQNLFMLNPTKGKRWGTNQPIPISVPDFWNLAGRAGRLGKDLQGKLFLINLSNWLIDPLTKDKKLPIFPSYLFNIIERTEKLIDFIKDTEHSSGQQQGLENTFVKLFNEYRSNSLDKTFGKINIEKREALKQQIVPFIEEASNLINVPEAILKKNISVSPYRQQQLLEYLVKKIKERGASYVVPVHPLVEWKYAYESLWRMFKRIHTNLERLPGKNREHFYFAPLALRWMRGEPLAQLIEDAYKYKSKKAKRKISIATVIREVMDDVEQDLRFRYVKYTSCYIDLLREALERTENGSLIDKIPNIAIFLELGASSKTMVSLIGVGLSRTTAAILTSKNANKDMDRDQAHEWITRQNLEEMGINNICIREINKVLG